MALVCPVGHPPGTGSFCRLCGRDYVEADVAPEAQAPAAAAPVVPAPAAPVEAPAAVTPGFGQPAPGPGGSPNPGFGQPAPGPGAAQQVMAQVVAMPPAAEPYQPHHSAPVPDVQVPPVPVEVGPGHGGVQLQAPVVAVPQQAEAPELEQASEVDEPSKAKAAVDRTLVLAAGGAGFVAGVLATLAASSLLG